jgi:uncharacterized repeat protein (TIGR02543 family)
LIATDASPAANKDSAILHIKYDNDKTAPTLKLFSPAKDSASVSSNAIVIQVVCKDPSGVASITYGMGSGSPQPMTKSASADSLWSANVTDLVPGYNTIRIIAVDSTLTANRDTLLLHILYDTTTTTNPKPKITLDPVDQTVLAGQPDSFSVAATGAGTLGYQWQKNGTDITGETKTILKITAVSITDTGSYTCVVSNSGGKVTSKAARMTVQFSVSYDSNGKTGGAVPAGANYNFGATVTVAGNTGTLVRTGYTFAGWNTKNDGSGTSYAAAATFTMGPANVTLYAKWTQNVTFALTVTATNGSVTKVPDLTAYDSGTVVTLTPVPATGFHFTGWSGALTGSANPATITMNGAKSVTAGFTINAPNSFALTIVATNGTVTKSPDAAQYDSGTVVSLTAVPAPGYQFTGWSGGLTGTTNPGSITMTAAKSVTATFVFKQFVLTITATNGTVIKAPNAAQYDSGTVVTLTPVPAPGYQFTGWSGGLTGTANPGSITMTAAKSVTATFTINHYTVTFNSQGGSTVTSQTVNYGLLATAPSPAPTKACNTFVAWYLGTSPFSFSTPITSDITLLANWTPSVYTPTAAVTPSAPVCAGNNATFSATMFNGNAPYSYQWYKTVSGTPSPVGTNSSSLSIPTTAETGGATASYTITCYCTITDNCGKQATSSPANVTVYYLPAAPIVEFATDIDGILLHCSVMQQNASTYFCCYYQYNKNGTGWTPWSNTGGGNTCDGLQTYMENAQAQSDVIQFKAYTKNTLTNCVSATTTENWQP